MNSHGLTRENLVATLPPALQKDLSVMALAEAMADLLAKRPEEIEQLRIYPVIDRLDEELLDILAYDFKVDWWDTNYSPEEKRRTLKTSWQVHRTLGTKAAVEKAASAVYPETRVEEWFEYGGEPYRFRLDVDLPEDEWTPEKHRRLMRRMQYYKNLRSHLDSVVYRMRPVELENHQVFWLAALTITAGGAENRRRAALEQLLLWARGEERQGESRIWLNLEASAAVQLSGALERVLFHMRAFNFEEVVRLDGRRRLDGSWLLNQGMIRGPALVSVNVEAAAGNRLSGSATVTADSMWRLDGAYRLDGGRKLNAEIKRSEL